MMKLYLIRKLIYKNNSLWREWKLLVTLSTHLLDDNIVNEMKKNGG